MEGTESDKPMESCVWSGKSESDGENEWVCCHRTAKFLLPIGLIIFIAQCDEGNGLSPGETLLVYGAFFL